MIEVSGSVVRSTVRRNLVTGVPLPFPLHGKLQLFLQKGTLTVTDLTSQMHYKIMLGSKISLVSRQVCMKYHFPKYCSNMKKKIPNSLRFSTNMCAHRLLSLAKTALGFTLMSSISTLVFSSSARAMCLFIFTTFL